VLASPPWGSTGLPSFARRAPAHGEQDSARDLRSREQRRDGDDWPRIELSGKAERVLVGDDPRATIGAVMLSPSD
jgi:hypothetical protein